MDTSRDKVILTTEERRILAVLEKATGHQALRRRLSMTVAKRSLRLRSPRRRLAGTVLLFITGAALMVATFTQWPAVAVIGAAVQACALWRGLTLLAPHIGYWISLKTARSVSDHRPTPPR
jgi:hypothetical protein